MDACEVIYRPGSYELSRTTVVVPLVLGPRQTAAIRCRGESGRTVSEYYRINVQQTIGKWSS